MLQASPLQDSWLGHTKLITCFSDSLATNADPGGGNIKKINESH